MSSNAGARGRFRIWAWAAAAFLLVAGAALALSARQAPETLGARPAAERQELLLLTSLPLVFAETFTIEGGSPALAALETRYSVRPIAVADTASLGRSRLLLMAHPRAQPGEALVELDAWVRAGGRLVLLADPKLDWPSSRPLGDILRPPTAFADTGLLRRWGLRLYAPEEAGRAQRRVAGRDVSLSSAGTLEGKCDVTDGGLIARCRIGRGRATVIADADFLNVDDAASVNLQMLLAELERIER